MTQHSESEPSLLTIDNLHALCTWPAFKCKTLWRENHNILGAHIALAANNLPNLTYVALPLQIWQGELELEVLDAIARTAVYLQCLVLPTFPVKYGLEAEFDSVLGMLDRCLTRRRRRSERNVGFDERMQVLLINYMDGGDTPPGILDWFGSRAISTLTCRNRTTWVLAPGYYHNTAQYVADIAEYFWTVGAQNVTVPVKEVVIHLHIGQLKQLAALIEALPSGHLQKMHVLKLHFVVVEGGQQGVDPGGVPRWTTVDPLRFMVSLKSLTVLAELTMTEDRGALASSAFNCGASGDVGLIGLYRLNLFDS
ncbi:hypothetical protein BKA62DRAFT_719376 [Auriculariales sp. MPI-PUGE-AT-0066]|nr:hypothetical protein BKA62DRAFT_719376 [Auriculariales sp. MPI-PUGE-AT-0066]